MHKFGHRFSWFQIRRSMRGWASSRSSDTQTVNNRMMLRFRPIAPKPVGNEDASAVVEQNREIAAGRRVKRKYVRVRGRQNKLSQKRKTREGNEPSAPEKSSVDDETPPEKSFVTLQLLEERSESDKNSYDSTVRKSQENWADPCDGDNEVNEKVAAESGGSTVDLRNTGSVMETWIIVECVTDKFTGVGLGFSDKERINDLQRDTCPGFVSDWTNNVIWVNDAYKRMVAEDEAAAAEKGCLVWLVLKEELPHICPSFACRVRVTQRKGQGQKWNQTVPCDVWRLEFTGFAWKLDVNTALSLGF